LFFDKDAGGVQAIESAQSLSQKYQVRVVRYPKGEKLDPAKLTAEQVAKALGKTIPLLHMTQRIKKARREANV
jgi:DNA primase